MGAAKLHCTDAILIWSARPEKGPQADLHEFIGSTI